ncbi:MAG: hypothetical protein R3B94_09215 [Hyphomonas sp.]
MSSYSYYSLMPHKVAVTCETCGKEASFEFAEHVKIKFRRDLAWFERSVHFECVKQQDVEGQSFHTAVYYHKLRTNNLPTIQDLPEGYEIEDWAHPDYKLYSRYGWRGTLICGSCGARRKHTLDWPREAYFQIAYKSDTLWAFDRESVSELANFIGADHRRPEEYSYWPFLMKIPQVFLTRSAREPLVKRLEKLLSVA